MSNFQGRVPVLLSLGFVAVILSTGYMQLRNWEGPMLYAGIAMVAFYLGWLAWEGKVAVAETKMKATGIDRGTLEFYAFARFLTVAVSLAVPSQWTELNPIMAAGAFLFVFGVVFRLIAIRTLGRFYSHRVRIRDDHQIVQEGPYSFLRHPAYSGMILCHFGFALFFFSVASLGVCLGVLVPAICVRILIEEKALFEIPGYAAFAQKRKRIVPFVW